MLSSLNRGFYRYRSYMPVPVAVVVLALTRPSAALFLTGLVVAALGESLRMWSLAHIGPKTRSSRKIRADQLVVTGPFAHLRNPLYVGNFTICSGVVLASGNLWLLPLLPALFFFWHRYIIPAEESFLESSFGDAFHAYCAEVPRYLPRWKPYRKGPGEFRFRETIAGELNTLVAMEILLVVLGWPWLPFLSA